MNRRGFFERLTTAALSAAGLVTLAGGGAMLAHSGADARASTTISAGRPADYPPGSLTLIGAVWLGRDNLGFYAIDGHCPHLGCLVKAVPNGFDCPCHGSRFDATGRLLQGPAADGLRFLVVNLAADGRLNIDRTRRVDPGERLIV